MESLVPEFDVLGFVRERSGNALPGIAPTNTYSTRDDKYVVIGANADAIFKRCMRKIGRDDLADDPRLADNAGRAARADELDDAIGAWTSRHDLDEVLRMLAEAEVPSGKVYDVRDIVTDAHYRARDMIREFRLADGKSIKLPGIVPKLSDSPGDVRWVGPQLGEHTAQVLSALGYDEAQQQALRELGVI